MKYPGRQLVLKIASGAREVQAVILTGFAGTDSFKLTYGGNESALITRGTNYTAAGIKAIIEAITGVTFSVSVSDVSDNGFLVSFSPGTRTALSVTTTTGVTGVVTQMAAGTAGASTTIGQVVALGEVGSKRNLIDASAYGDDWMDFVTGQQEGDEVAIGLAYDPADSGHLALKAAYDGGTNVNFEMVHADSGFDVTFPAAVLAFSRGGAKDGLLTASTSVKILNPGVQDV